MEVRYSSLCFYRTTVELTDLPVPSSQRLETSCQAVWSSKPSILVFERLDILKVARLQGNVQPPSVTRMPPLIHPQLGFKWRINICFAMINSIAASGLNTPFSPSSQADILHITLLMTDSTFGALTVKTLFTTPIGNPGTDCALPSPTSISCPGVSEITPDSVSSQTSMNTKCDQWVPFNLK